MQQVFFYTCNPGSISASVNGLYPYFGDVTSGFEDLALRLENR
jgi:hypothetical protein